ncbi:MAG: hypothetical protein H0T89_22600 [Deltaproteobacteria bacterium]|nr:hypothetical protein [Deltaproteobacteria bacterium]MDQ3299276.1 hypothetical protein [Myxococcota bacterium]
MKLLSTVALAALLTTTFAAREADAEPKSWTAAKAVLPDNVTVLAGANLISLRKTAAYQQLVPALIKKEPDARQVFDIAKTTCAIDLHTAIEDATVAISDDEKGLVVVGLATGIDQKKVVECLDKLAVQMAKAKAPPAKTGLKAGAAKKKPAPTPKVVTKTIGKITEYSIEGEPKKLYLAWLTPDVVAISTTVDDRALLEKLVSGKGVKGAMSGTVGKVNTSATLWLATTKQTPISQTGSTMKSAFGTIDASGGQVRFDIHAIMASAAEAKKFVDDATAMLGVAKSQVPPQFANIVDGLKLSAKGDDAMMKLDVTEKDLQSILSLLMMSL